MEQKEARRIAKMLAANSDIIPIVDTIRETATGGFIRGGYTHKDQTWAVFLLGSNAILFPVELRNREVFEAPESLELTLRKAERDIATDLRDHPSLSATYGGMTAERWEEIRHWPGEFRDSGSPEAARNKIE
jgi:hypothetical protein